jgi:hypothetical protein
MHTYMHTHTHTCAFMQIHTYIHIHATCVFSYTHACIHSYIHTCAFTYIHTYTHTFIYMYTLSHTHIYVHVYTHTPHSHTHALTQSHTLTLFLSSTDTFHLTPIAKYASVGSYTRYFYVNVTSTDQPLLIQVVPVILVKASIFVTTTYGSCVGTSFQVTTPPFTITITDSTPIKLMVGIWYVRVQAITAGITPISDNEKNNIAIGVCYGIDFCSVFYT